MRFICAGEPHSPASRNLASPAGYHEAAKSLNSHSVTDDPAAATSSHASPRAFTQGVGTVFQVVGVVLFLASFFVCCGSSLLSRDTATQTDLTTVGWNLAGSKYSGQQAVTICLLLAVFCGMGLASLGLGLQAQHRRAPYLAAALCGGAAIFWTAHAVLFGKVGFYWLCLPTAALAVLSVLLLVLACVSLREMRRNPPAAGFELLPADYKVPYSHLHEDPPEVRLAREVEQRRARLEVEQKEIESLEAKLKRKLQQRDH